ncbi:hypothetical protein KFK09_002440 [Dendrobium nobile]|uniref:Endonuclease/exonuclease/phosphatase domain-containing protein n=1 Tax=Dendrobium nobile TaxID=94219 RepID=A0A8T3C3Q4_DENNO|nr:hypothetical protein KFK09_002440 [Dendrobium nobile]
MLFPCLVVVGIFSMYLSVGLAGGILVSWDNSLASFTVLDSSPQFVIGELDVLKKGRWRIAIIYGSKDVYVRRLLWEKLETFSGTDLPMVIGGDFNCLLTKEDKRGGRRFSFSIGPREMKSFLTSNDLHEVGYVGPKYTWSNNKLGADRILERLDRCFLNSSAISLGHRMVVRHP